MIEAPTFNTLDDAVAFGSGQMAVNKNVHRVMFFPADAAPPPEMPGDTLIILVKQLIHPNWHMITRNIGFGDDLCERTLLDALIQIENFKEQP